MGIEVIGDALAALAAEIARDAAGPRRTAPRVSVIVPCFNSAAFIDICLGSLRRQTLPQDSFEVLCIDDCSTDETAALLDRHRQDMPNLRILRHAVNRKQGAARNTGIEAARGDYVFFLDSDDFLRVDALEILVNSAADADVVICQHVTERFDRPFARKTSGRQVRGTLPRAILENTIGWWPFGLLIARRLLVEGNIRFREGVFFEDIDFNIRVFLAARTGVVLKEPLYHYIVRDGSTVTAIDDRKLADSVAAMEAAWALAAKVAPEDRKAFVVRAADWLLLQAGRVRDSAHPAAEKARLAEDFARAIGQSALGEHLPADFPARLRQTATAAARAEPAAAPGKPFRYNPWPRDFAPEFRDRVIFFCEVDYHVRSAVHVARALRDRGVASIIVDASRSTSFSANRPLAEAELAGYADVDIHAFNVAETLPFATDAAAFVFMNDITYTKRLIFENFGFGVPTFGFYEGINDDWNLDRGGLRMPYRSVDYLLLPGIYQQGFYADRASMVVGLPNVRTRLAAPFAPPRVRRAVINVNFTYGVLEDRRDAFLDSAVEACRAIGLDYVVSQHPADRGDLSAHPVARTGIYDLLDEGSILISRFSTTILEALAMGRPAVYHNPIGERVPKFSRPLGAYPVTQDAGALAEALQRELAFAEGGGDVRARAALFLHFHCHTLDPRDPAVLAADAIADVLMQPPARLAFKTGASERVRIPPPGTIRARPAPLADIPGTSPRGILLAAASAL
ncbi:MAG: glycosyltransferase family 2 protein, partial [Rubrimonas sp.]